MKKIRFLLLALVALVGINVSAKTVYLKTTSAWTDASARIALYYFEDAETVTNLGWTNFGDSDFEGILTATIPDGNYDKMIVVRQNPANEENSWTNQWGQSANMDIPANDYTIYVCPDAVNQEVFASKNYYGYVVRGASALLGTTTDWDADLANIMTKTADGKYTITKNNVTLDAGSYKFKIVLNDDAWYPLGGEDNNWVLNIARSSRYDVTITIDPANDNYITAIATDLDPDLTYTYDFNTAINTESSDFKVASNWKHIVDVDDSDNNMHYKHEPTLGVDGTGTLLAYEQRKYNYMQNGTVTYDMLVTPVVSGTVTIYAKPYSASSTTKAFVEFYKLNEDATAYVGEPIVRKEWTSTASATFEAVTTDVTSKQRIGIRAQNVYLDNFSATSATIVPEASLSVDKVMNSDGQTGTTGTNPTFEQQPDGNMLAALKVQLSNTGDVDFTTSTENYTLTLGYASSASGTPTYFEGCDIAIPEALAVGETKTFSVEFSVPFITGNKYWFVKENVSSTTTTNPRYGNEPVAYVSKFVFREAGSTETSSISSAQNWGTITESTSKNFEVTNTGIAPLTITAYTAPAGFTLTPGFNPMSLPEGVSISGTSIIMQGGAVLPFTVTQDASATGTYSGTLTIVYQDYGAENTTNYTLDFSATVIGANTWAADFNNTTSTAIYPAGSVKENGITTDWDNKTSDGKYNIYLKGQTGTSYATENNKFITPKLHAAAGDKLTFDVKAGYSTSDNYFVKVYVSTDRKTWGEPVETYVYSNVGSSFTTKTISFDAEGDYYVAFAIYGTGSGIDNLVGLEKVAVAHDLYIKSVSWPDASIKSGASQSKPSVDIIPLTDEVANNYTVKYIYGENVVEIASKALTASASSTTSFAASFTPEAATTTTYPGTKVVFEFTDGTKFETEGFDLTVTNEAIFHFVKTLPSSKWHEPTDYTTPITFGKTNTADAQTFYVYNWGSAPLTVKSIAVPAGFTATPTEQFTVAAFDENDLSVAAQAVEITFSATEAGTYSGDMVITYVDGAGADATFSIAVSGTKLDPTKFYANFDNPTTSGAVWPAGSVYQGIEASTANYSAPYNYYLTGTGSFITPKLTATAGEKLLFDAKLYNSSWSEGKVVVYAAATREEVLNAEEGTTRTQVFSVSGQDAEGAMTTDYQTFEVPALAGDYYYGFEISNRPSVDEIYGLTQTAVKHDWTIVSKNIPTEAMQNYSKTATVNILNLGLQDEAAEDITVTAYVNNVAVATAEGVAIPMSHKLSDAGTQLSVNFMSTVAGTFPVYVEVKAGDYSVATEPVEVVFAEEEVKTEADIAVNGTTGDVPLNLLFKNSESITLYNAEALANAGISAGTKIKKITYKGYKTSDVQTTSFQVYYKWTDDQTLAQPATAYPYAAADNGMTKLIDEDHTWAKVGSSSEMGDMIVLDFTENPLKYEPGKSLVIYMHSYVDGYKAAYFEKSTLSQDYCYVRKADAATLSSDFSKAVPAAIHFTLDASVAKLAGSVKTSGREAIEGATVTLKAANGVEYSGTTAADGSYSINVVQAGLDFTATVEAENYLKKEFDYSLGGESKTLDVTLYKSFGLVGSFPGLSWNDGEDVVMTQSTEDPNVFTLTLEDVELNAAKYEYKLRADGIWKSDGNDGYQLPSDGSNNDWTFKLAGKYTLKFTANVSEHTLALQPIFTLEDNTTAIADADLTGVTIAVERQFKAGCWNAVVLPFDLSAEEVTATFGTTAEIAYYDGDESNNGDVTVKFNKRPEGDIVAGVPYLLWSENEVSGLELTGRNIKDDQWPTTGTTFDFVGVYTTTDVNAGDYFVQGGKFVKATSGNTVKPFRSYLKLKGSNPDAVRSINFVVGDEATAIEGLTVERDYTNDAIYNLNGQKVQQPTKRGLYIINGKKVMVK